MLKQKIYSFITQVLILILPAVSLISANSSLDSLRQQVNNSLGSDKVEYSIKLAKKLIEYSKIREGLIVAENVLAAGKESGNIKYQLQAYSIMSRGYLVGGELMSAVAYGDSTMKLARAHNDTYGMGLAYQASGTPKMYLGDVQGALNTLDSSLVIFTAEDDPIEIATTKLLIASVFAATGQAEASFPYLEEAKKIFVEHNDQYKSATVDLNIGLIKGTILGLYEEAINISLKVLPYFELVEDSLKIATCNSTIASCYDAIGNYDRAIEYYEYAVNMMGINGNILMKGNFINNLGEVYKHKEDYANAHKYYKEALDIFTTYGINEGIIVAENNIGECLMARGEYTDALSYFRNSLDKVDKQNDHYKLAILYKNIGKVYLNTNNLAGAILYLKKSIESAVSLELLEEIFPAYESLAEAYGKRGDYNQAFKYHKLYAKAKDEFIKFSNAEKISDIDAKYQTVKKEKEIEILTKNQEIQRLQISKQRDFVLALIFVVVLIGVFSIIIYKRYRDNQKLNAALEERNAQILTQQDELKNINEQLTYTNEKLLASEKGLKHLNATKDKFFSIIAHDLKGPFSSLLGLTEIMAEDSEEMTDHELQKMSLDINKASRKVYALTENLLEWSRAQLDMLNIKRELFDFNELVDNNARLYKSSLQAKGIKLNQALCRESIVNTDKDMVDFALRNLLTNAIKFTKQEGEINISSSVEKEYLKVEVSDTGIGIPEEAIDKLFKIESTFTTSGTEEEKGTGLGLVLVREFIEKIGGAIFVNSKVNFGTTFTFTIPIAN